MAINTTRLATSLGKIFGGANEINTYRGTTVATRTTTIYTQLTTATEPILSGLYAARDAAKASENGWMGYLKELTTQVIIAEVKLDRPLQDASITSAVHEWVRQMVIAGDSFNDSPSTLTNAAVGSPTATGYQFVTNTQDGTGVAQDLIVPDVYLVIVTGDKDHGGTRWAETLSVTSKPADTAATDDTYPTGTGLSTTLTIHDPAAGTGLITDPSFSLWTDANTPTDWSIHAGTGGVHVRRAADDPRDGASGFCLRFDGDGVVIPKVRQLLNVQPSQVLVVHFRTKKVLDPGTDWAVSVRLTDGDGTQLTGPGSHSNIKTSVTAGSVAADWTNVYTATFITPASLPTTGVYLEIVFHEFAGGVTVAAANATEVLVDHVDIKTANQLYAGGPYYDPFSGLTSAVNNDTWTLTAALTAGTMSSFMIRWLDRMLDLKSYSFRIPTITGGAETQADALIS